MHYEVADCSDSTLNADIIKETMSKVPPASVRAILHTFRYCIGFNILAVIYLFYLYGTLNSWQILPVGMLVLLAIDMLFLKNEPHDRKPNRGQSSLYAGAAIFLIGASAGYVKVVEGDEPLYLLLGLIFPVLVGGYFLRVALRTRTP